MDGQWTRWTVHSVSERECRAWVVNGEPIIFQWDHDEEDFTDIQGRRITRTEAERQTDLPRYIPRPETSSRTQGTGRTVPSSSGASTGYVAGVQRTASSTDNYSRSPPSAGPLTTILERRPSSDPSHPRRSVTFDYSTRTRQDSGYRTSAARTSATTTSQGSRDRFPSENRRTETQNQAAPTRAPRRTSETTSLPEATLIRAVQRAPRIEKNNRKLYPPARKPLDSSFQLQLGHFFKRGRVFAVLWHENFGAGKDGLTQARNGTTEFTVHQKHGEQIYSTIRRMIVIKCSAASSLCVPIYTHGGQGCLKPGLHRREIHHHTVVHDSRIAAWYDPRERTLGMVKRPIAIDMVPKETLDKWSRVRFDKVYNIEHDFKVKNIGLVTEQDMHLLVTYFREGVEIPD